MFFGSGHYRLCIVVTCKFRRGRCLTSVRLKIYPAIRNLLPESVVCGVCTGACSNNRCGTCASPIKFKTFCLHVGIVGLLSKNHQFNSLRKFGQCSQREVSQQWRGYAHLHFSIYTNLAVVLVDRARSDTSDTEPKKKDSGISK